MGAEQMIYIYLIVCISMVMFNFVCNIFFRFNEPRMKVKAAFLRRNVRTQMNNIRKGEGVSEKHMRFICRKMQRPNNLLAFEIVLGYIMNSKKYSREYFDRYMIDIYPSLLYLSVKYYNKAGEYAAYYAYFLSVYAPKRNYPIDSLQDILIEYTKMNNFYCRVNALTALCSFGSINHIVKALQIQSEERFYIHDKIITECLMSFTGNTDILINKLWENFKGFYSIISLGILNFIRLRSGSYKQEMLEMANDSSCDKELRLAAIHYLGHHSYMPAFASLVKFAVDTTAQNWEYAMQGIAALAAYPGKNTITILKEGLHHPNREVRQAAIKSLDTLKVDKYELADIIGGDDIYASEAVLYYYEQKAE